jgi:hypothetical protein
MRFTPKSEAEIAQGDLFPAGVYDFEVNSAEEAVSKAGNDMIKVRLDVFNDDGGKTTVFDYLMEAAAYKLRHMAEVCGLLDDYESGHLDADDLVGKAGRVKIGIQKDKTGQYADKNNVVDYIVEDKRIASLSTKPMPRRGKAADLDDDIPF